MPLTRSRLRRWHVWLGWIIALPVLFLVISGLVMVWKPIEEVRGEHLLRELPPVQLESQPVPPNVAGAPIETLTLAARASGPRWVIGLPDGTKRLADPASGRLIPALSAMDATREVQARYTGSSRVVSVSRTDPANPPLDLRRPIAAWLVTMADDTRFYVDSGSGEVVARRTPWWRFYDFMWGLHIMDLETREDAHNPLLLGFAGIALLMSVLAMILLPLTINRRRRRPIRQD